MSNTQITASSQSIKELKAKYLELISNGTTEKAALEQLSFPKPLYLKLLLEDIDFAQDVENHRKLRADFWVSKIAEGVDKYVAECEVASERLKFDKLQFLAKADNPDKYGNNRGKIDVNIDLGQFRMLPPEEAKKALASDPFAIEVDFKEVHNEPEDDLL